MVFAMARLYGDERLHMVQLELTKVSEPLSVQVVTKLD
jgi:hypothetical protein